MFSREDVALAPGASKEFDRQRYRRVRNRTEAPAALSPEDQGLQSMPDASPPRWHRAQATWLFRGIHPAALPAQPISIPTIKLEGDANGAPHAVPKAYAEKFLGKYQHRTIGGGIGHNLPQEAPRAIAQAVVDVKGMRLKCAPCLSTAS